MTHGLVFGGIGLDLGAIQGHVAQAHQACLLAQPQHLHKQARQCIEMNEAEITDPAVVGLLVAGEHPERGIFPAGPLDPPGGGDADAVGIEQKQHHHPRLVGLDPTRIPRLVDRINRREIQLSGQVQQEEHQMVRRQPLHRRGRQQQRLLRVPGTEGFGLAHAPFFRPDPLLSLGSGQIGGRLWRSGWRGLCATGS